MQSIYALHQKNSNDIEKEEKFLMHSIDSIFDLYLTILSALVEIQKKEIEFLDASSKKHLATPQEKNPNKKFIQNSVIKSIADSPAFKQALDKRRINNWINDDSYILLLLADVKKSDIYERYMLDKKTSFEDDKKFILDIFEKVLAPNEKLYEYLEDYKLTWVDDIPVVNTQILKDLKSLSKDSSFEVSKLYKDIEDKEFVSLLFRKTVLNEVELAKEYIDKTPNWDADRIAEMDTIILKMAICELLKFPSIPVKVTINEYLELAKEYSTPKSSIFINGILDNLVKEFTLENKIKKTGRGLL
ncbi:transcription antitermination factor NusB [Flavobacterium sp.]|uniref:transcription antitermination factor NusB n=1 Tax=Flavobacterium sp. TaxID=239 RepID=UPI0035ADD98C